MNLPAAAGALRRIAQFAWLVRNEVRPRGLARVGLPCQLMGSGMAFPWHMVAGGRLASGHLVEDLKLGLELAQAGSAPLFCPDALVSSVFPASAAGVASQRRRWEHGHLSVLCAQGPRLLLRALARFASWLRWGLQSTACRPHKRPVARGHHSQKPVPHGP